MTVTIQALDNEFAASTRSNVNNGPGTSTFDYPPTATTGLVITSQPGDLSPYRFNPGDTYTLSWGGMGGNQTIQNATILRSDPISVNGDSGHAIVFEGLNQSGELVQIVWTPDFDLEAWYFNNFQNGQSPGFYTSDTNPSAAYAHVCFAEGTRIATPRGERPVEELRAGDLVLTRNGQRALRWAGHRRVPGIGPMAPVVFAPGAVGNRRRLVLSQQHRVVLRSALSELYFAAPEVLVPARTFCNGRDIRIEERPEIVWHHLLFDGHEILRAEGAECESLLLGEVARGVLGAEAANAGGAEARAILGGLPEGEMRAALPILRAREAALILGPAVAMQGPAPRAVAQL